MVRSTIDVKHMTARERETAHEEGSVRNLPLVRADCEFGPRPCPYISCFHHLASNLSVNGNVSLAFMQGFLDGDEELGDDFPETCALDVAAEGPSSLQRIAQAMQLTRERVRQIEATALKKLSLSKKLRLLKSPP